MAWYRTGGGGTDTSDATLNNSNQMLSGVTAYANDVKYTGSIETKTASDLTTSGATVTVPSGYYAVQATKDVSAGILGTATAIKGTVSNHSISITPQVAAGTAGYNAMTAYSGDAVSVSANELVSGSLTITTNTTTDVTNYASAVTNIPQAVPIEVNTDAGMTAVLTSANVGKCYKFTGTTGTYTNGDLYVVEEAE